jgi:hypothetical protein
MRILFVNNHYFGGVEYYRALQPANVLISLNAGWEAFTAPLIHPTKDVSAKINGEDILIDDNFLKSFDLIHFLRQIGNYDQTQGIVDRLNRLGIPFGLDLDDFWYLPENHLIYKEYKASKSPECIINSIKAAHFVTCTTSILGYEIMKHNTNVEVIENGLDPYHEKWQLEGSKSERLRFGLMLGATHYHDLKKAAPSINNLLRSSEKGYQIVLAGFNAEPKRPSIYIGMEKQITDDFNLIDKNYAHFLKMCRKERNEDWNNQKYVRLWSLPVQDWGHAYKEIDISVVPLVDNLFNNCKSELKAIEAAFKGKGIIASNVPPYTICLNEKNSYLVNNSREFYDKMKRAIHNPNEVVDKILQLRADIMPKYNLQTLSEKRKQIYEKYK